MRKYNRFLVDFLLLILGFLFIASCSGVQEEFIAPKDAHKYVGEVKTVCGTVASARYSIQSRGRPTFLNLDVSYPDHIFTVVIWGENRDKFENPPESFFDGKTIYVTGRIETYRGKAQVEVKDPSQIRVKPTP